MNRKILFRGKRKDNGKWTYGTPIPISMPDASALLVFDGNMKILEIVPETLGEYTGLGDKNDGAIFEGDIVRDNVGKLFCYKMTTIHREDSPGKIVDVLTAIFPVPIELSHLNRLYGVPIVREPEIIGNIHDSPELIGGKQNETN